MIDFSKYRRIEIPEGMVKTIKRKSDGLILWIAKYLNIILGATTDPGGTEIYNGIGYKDGARWSMSGEKIEEGVKSHRVSGWMKHEANKTYRVKNFGIDYGDYLDGIYIAFAKADGSIIHTLYTSTTNGTKYTTNYTIDLARDLVTFVNRDANAKYFRISGVCSKVNSGVTGGNVSSADYLGDPIITCDEEITD